MSDNKNIFNVLSERILFLDGGMGTQVQRLNLTEADYRGERFASHGVPLSGNSEVLVLTHPEIIKDIHLQYLAAHADIIETCTFNANRLSQKAYHLESCIDEINSSAVQIAREAVAEYAAETGRTAWVAGSVGPTGHCLSMPAQQDNVCERNVDFDVMVDVYEAQIRALLKAGVDAILLETAFDTLVVKAAGYALRKLDNEIFGGQKRTPLMLSVTILDNSGRMLCGQTLDAFCASIAHLEPISVGVNCGMGAEEMQPLLETLSCVAPFAVSCHPNAGRPDANGQYHDTPDGMAKALETYARRGWLNIAGGCCGTTPEHIRQLHARLSSLPPRAIPEASHSTVITGLETCHPGTGICVVGERGNVTGSKKFKRLVEQQDDAAALDVLRQQTNKSCALDICMDDAMLNGKGLMQHFMRLIAAEPEISRLPVVIDSSHFETVCAGLKELQGKSLVNSISLKEGEAHFIRKAKEIHALGATMIVMAFDEEGQAVTTERRLAVLRRAIRLLVEKAEIPLEDIAVDANILAVGTGIAEHDFQATSFLETCEILRREYPSIQTIGGLSNLSFAFRGNMPLRRAIHAVFLDLAEKDYHGALSLVIADPGQIPDVETLPEELRGRIRDLLLHARPDAIDRLLEWSETHDAPKEVPAGKDNPWDIPLEARIQRAFLTGDTTHLAADMAELQQQFSSGLEIVEGPLMNAMNEVGRRFAAGELFLPQVVKSARVMKEAMACLPLSFQSGSVRQKRILLATVNGDVHDIGKNIVGMVLTCNGYEVIDLGVMVPTSQIVEAAVRQQVDFIGLSGLISPSLSVICEVADALREANIDIPLCVGGAAVSAEFVAVRLAPRYGGLCIYASDASQLPGELSRYLVNPEEYAKSLEEMYSEIRYKYVSASSDKVSLEDARLFAKVRVPGVPRRPVPPFAVEIRYAIPMLMSHIPWGMLHQLWKRPETDNADAFYENLQRDTERAIHWLSREGTYETRAKYQFFDADAENEDVHLYHSDELVGTLHYSRKLDKDSDFMSLADYLPQHNSGLYGTAGIFIMSCGFEYLKHHRELTRSLGMDRTYSELIMQTASNLLVEAASQYQLGLMSELYGKMLAPAVGYPACPEHADKRMIFDLLDAYDMGMSMTPTSMMVPASSVCGSYILVGE